ncbi:hypothetical protein NM04_26100 [Massilia aurea]|uniref:Uncharacterized protein n=1 Tax=Massilia aurea TaxID=373040 RepID=A0A422QD19_9BURK|nr:hypothetical protein NM04_26100 [Massilia aurea]
MPVDQLDRALAARAADHEEATPAPLAENIAAEPRTAAAKCPECGARALHKVDGCARCAECHYIGSCG